MLRNIVGDVVVVALVRDEDVHRDSGAGGSIEGPHGDADPILVQGVEKEWGAACGTEASAYLLRRAKPGHVLAAVNRHVGARNIGTHQEMTRDLPTIRTVARVGCVEATGNFETHGAAEA